MTQDQVSSDGEVIDTDHMALDEWLALLRSQPKHALYVSYRFPSDNVCDAYLQSVHARTEDEVKWLLRHFLWLPCSFGLEEWHFQAVARACRHGSPPKQSEARDRLLLWKLSRGRLPRWDGVRWVLDLLSTAPARAVAALWAYFLAHGAILPDGRMHGLLDSIAVIKNRFMSTPTSGEEFNVLDSREFECLVAALYTAMGYQTVLTPAKSDGGRDIIATSTEDGRRERALIEVKHHRSPIGVAVVRQLLGVVVSEKATRGVLVASSRFTRGAQAFAKANASLELIEGHGLGCLLAAQFGPRWNVKFEEIIAERMRPDLNTEIEES